MSQEFAAEQENFWNGDGVDQPEVEQPAEQAAEVVAQPEGRIPVEKYQEVQQEARYLKEELHQVKMAMLQAGNQAQYQAQSSSVDPIATALGKIKAQKNVDPDAYNFVSPMLEPILAELNALRQRDEYKDGVIQQLTAGLNQFAAKDRANEAHNQLAKAIPDLDKIGPQLIDLVSKLPAEMQDLYAKNPVLLLPLADAVRGSAKPGRNVQAERNRVGIDAGGGATPTLNAISNAKIGTPAWEAERSAFYGSSSGSPL